MSDKEQMIKDLELAGLTDYDPGSFRDFCNNFGYDCDSISAEKVYNGVCEEWANVKMLWSDDEIELLREVA